MSRCFPFPERVPLQAVDRLLQQFCGMLTALAAAGDAIIADESQSQRIDKAHALLTAEQGRLESEARAFREDDRTPLLQHAWELRRLARRMDARWTASTGKEPSQQCAMAQRLVVLTAWQISAAASGSEAAGL